MERYSHLPTVTKLPLTEARLPGERPMLFSVVTTLSLSLQSYPPPEFLIKAHQGKPETQTLVSSLCLRCSDGKSASCAVHSALTRALTGVSLLLCPSQSHQLHRSRQPPSCSYSQAAKQSLRRKSSSSCCLRSRTLTAYQIHLEGFKI